MIAEAAGAVTTHFFRVQKCEHQVVAHAGEIHERPRRFQHGDAAADVVRGAGSVGHGIIVGTERDRTRTVRAWYSPNDRLLQLQIVTVQIRCGQELHLKAHLLEGIQKVLCRFIVVPGSGRTGFGGAGEGMFHSTIGRKCSRRGILGQGTRRLQGIHRVKGQPGGKQKR